MNSSSDPFLLDLVVIYSPDLELQGRWHPLGASEAVITVGRASENTVVLHRDSVSRRHARFERRADGWWVVDRESSGGTLVNDQKVQEARVRAGDRIHIGDTILKLYHAGDRGIVETDYSPTPFDGLTKLHNRRHLVERIEEELRRTDAGTPPALVLFDLDRFKRVNDTFGHHAGDEVLRGVAALLQRHARPGDVVARYSGDELVWLLPGTDLQAAAALAEEVRAEVAAHPFPFEEHAISITVSAGIAQANERTRTVADLLRAVDQDLHSRRQAGLAQALSGSSREKGPD